jgi:DNA polymerase-3 subunit alpha
MTAGEADVPEWDTDQLLLQEKEVLGFYLSGHPLKRVSAQAARLGAVTTAELANRPESSQVLVCGLSARVQEVNTRRGERMAFVTLEDMQGAVEVTVFPELLRQSAAHLQSGVPLLVRGRVEGGASARKLLAEEIRPLPTDDGGSPPGEVCRISFGATEVDVERLQALKRVCEAHPGTAPLYLHVEVGGQEVVLRPRRLCVRVEPALVAAVGALLGDGRLSFDDG